MTQFRAITVLAVSGLLAGVPVSAQGKSAIHGAGVATTHGKPTATGVTTRGKNGQTPPGKNVDTTRGKSTEARGRSGERTSATTTTTGTSPLAAKIARNPEQLSRVTAMLPPDMTLEQATAGFRNQGQFIAALNASKNQGVSFVDLQKAMTVDGVSLGQAVRKLKSEAPPTPGTTTNTPTTDTAKS
jgi:hypothetical protein